MNENNNGLVHTNGTSYKIKSVSGFNFAGYSSIMINLDERVTYLVGRNGSGKSKAGLDLIWFVFQGIAEKASDGKIPLIGERFRFIGKEGATALGEIVLYDEVKGHEIRIIRKLTKAGTELTFSGPIGMELDQQWLNNLFNIFLIAPKRFIELSSKEQALALGIDTSKWDLQIAEQKKNFTTINKELKAFDNLEVVEKVERISLDALQAKKTELKAAWDKQYQENQKHNRTLRETWESDKKQVDREVSLFNEIQQSVSKKAEECKAAYLVLRNHGCISVEVADYIDKIVGNIQPLQKAFDLYPAEPEYMYELPDDSETVAVDQQIMEATATNQKALLYEQYLQKLRDKAAKENELQSNKESQADLEAQRLEYITAFEFPLSKLSVDDEGGLLLSDKPLKPAYFSTGELVRIIPSLMATQNPELKYVFLQEFNMLDEDMQKLVEQELTAKGFQLVIEMVGKEKILDKNCILLRDFRVVDEYPKPKGQLIDNAKTIES